MNKKAKKAQIEEIKNQRELLFQQIRKLGKEKEILEEELILPALKKEHEGKYFRTDRGSTANLYTHVKEVKNSREYIVDSFEFDIDISTYTISVDASPWYSENLEVEITKKEFESQLAIIKKGVGKIWDT